MRSIQRYPRYVQRASHRPPNQASSRAKDIDRHFSWDYMGSSEFEFGTLARTMNNFMHDWMKKGKVWAPKKLKMTSEKGEHVFWYVGPIQHESTCLALLEDQLREGKWDLHERTDLKAACNLIDMAYPSRIDSWLAIPTEISRGYGSKEKWVKLDCKDRPFAFFLKKEAAKAFLKGLDERQHRWEEETRS